MTDVTNASTLLFNIHTDWDDDLSHFNIPRKMLEVRSSSEVYGKTNTPVLSASIGAGLPETSCLIGQACFTKGW
jgi:glycerol kinase